MPTERIRTAVIWRFQSASLGRTLMLWCDRARQRRQLRWLDDHLLRDIGIDRISARHEFEKPFWKG